MHHPAQLDFFKFMIVLMASFIVAYFHSISLLLSIIGWYYSLGILGIRFLLVIGLLFKKHSIENLASSPKLLTHLLDFCLFLFLTGSYYTALIGLELVV